MKVDQASLNKLDFPRITQALADRASSAFGVQLALALTPSLSLEDMTLSWQRTDEALQGPELSLGGVQNVKPLLQKVYDGEVLLGEEILSIAHTMDAAATTKRAVLASERPALAELASGLASFDGALRRVREQLDIDGKVRDDATPKLRDIRRKLRPLRERIRNKLTSLLSTYSDFVQDALVTLRRERYVIPVKASFQSKVPGIALDSSDSGATVFIEPQSVVPMNNELALLEFDERDEVKRILLQLGHHLAYQEGLDASFDILATLDLIQASARLAKDWQLAKPKLSEGDIQLVSARHPLIENCVANDLNLSSKERLLVITGPNAGGKTVLLKTLGVAVLMAHSGLFIAAEAEKAILPEFQALLTDIGDEQSIEASLSTYAGHLKNLKEIAEFADKDVLILIDELGSGTDPAEGAALSQAVIENVLQSQAKGLITTHLAPLKVFASETEGIQNAAMRFDVERLQPSYRLTVGQPGRSYALAIAERIGLSPLLLERASLILGPRGERLETLLETLELQRLALENDVQEARLARDKALAEAEILRQQINKLREQEADVMAAAARKAESALQDTLKQASTLRRKASTEPHERSKALEDLQALRQRAKEQAQPKAKVTKPPSDLQVGTRVYVKSYEAEGPVVALRGQMVVVQLGQLKIEVKKRDVTTLVADKQAKNSSEYSAPSQFDSELNIRGQRVEEGLEKVRDFILEAHALKTPSVRILHGKGTGALRDAVRNYLKNEKRVSRFEDAIPYEGGHGVTVAYLKPKK